MRHITQQEFNDWLLKQPEDRKFLFIDNCGCLFASAFKEILGLPDIRCSSDSIGEGFKNSISFERWAQDLSTHIALVLDNHFTVEDVRSIYEIPNHRSN